MALIGGKKKGYLTEEERRRLLELQQAASGMGSPEGTSFAATAQDNGPPVGRAPGSIFKGPAPAFDMQKYEAPGDGPPRTSRGSMFGGSKRAAPIVDAPMMPLQNAPAAPASPDAGADGGYSPYRALPENLRASSGDLNQYGGYAPEKHRNFGQQVLRALPLVAAGIVGGPGAALAVAGHRQAAAGERQFDREAFNQLVRQGISPTQAHIMLTDPKSMAQNFNQQLSPYTLNPGDVRGLPGQGMVRNPAGAEQYAVSLGLQPGTPEWNTAIQDYALKAQGPTGFQHAKTLQDARLKVQRYGIDTRSSDSRYGVDTRSADSRYGVDTRSADSRYGVDTRDRTTRRGQEKTPVGTFQNGRDEPVVVYKDGTTQPVHNARPMSRSGRSGSGVRFGGRAAGGGGSRPQARNAKGEVIEWNGSAWVPAN
jgi:hypothetical protein